MGDRSSSQYSGGLLEVWQNIQDRINPAIKKVRSHGMQPLFFHPHPYRMQQRHQCAISAFASYDHKISSHRPDIIHGVPAIGQYQCDAAHFYQSLPCQESPPVWSLSESSSVWSPQSPPVWSLSEISSLWPPQSSAVRSPSQISLSYSSFQNSPVSLSSVSLTSIEKMEYVSFPSELSEPVGKADVCNEQIGFIKRGQQTLSITQKEALHLRRSSMAVEQTVNKSTLSNEYSHPVRPIVIQLNFVSSAVKYVIIIFVNYLIGFGCVVSWDFPDLSAQYNYKQRIEICDDLVLCESVSPPVHITSCIFKTVPGKWYSVVVSIFGEKGKVVAEGHGSLKATFSLDEIDSLMGRAIRAAGKSMQCFNYLYRCKPRHYWDKVCLHRDGIMEKYLKDDNGQAASPINGEIEGLFFAARTLRNGSLPLCSPFGDVRMHLPASSLLNPVEINMYFSDYYCNRLKHYVTVVACKKGSSADSFCQDRVKQLDIWDNPFLRIEPLDCREVPFAYFVSNRIGVEIYYTENVPLELAVFNTIEAIGAGTSRVGGLPHNKSCLKCNLYPIRTSEYAQHSPILKKPTKRKASEKSSEFSVPVKSTRVLEGSVSLDGERNIEADVSSSASLFLQSLVNGLKAFIGVGR